MQTFLPDHNFNISAKILDYRRLGKQRVEAFQIINLLERLEKGETVNTGWQYHPAVKMWQGHTTYLKAYFNAIVQEWIDRGYKNNMKVYVIDYNTYIAPKWIGDDRLHSSHRANLLRKLPEHYSKFGWKEQPQVGYWWPWRRINKQWVQTE